jgi:4-amino-4-deoxy-L-arabinose transferase-like glycosyltransferase
LGDDDTPVLLDAADAQGAARRFRRSLSLIVLAGALWRFGFVTATKLHRELLLNDSLYYSWQGVQLADGVWFRDITASRPAAEHGPLTAILLAPFSWGSEALFQQRLATAACGVATVALVGLIGRRIGGDRVGLVAAGLAAVYPNLWINDGLVMSESLGCLLVAAIVLAVLRLLEQPSPARALAAGALIGLGALTRSELILLVVLLAAVLLRWLAPLRVAWRSAALAAAGTLAVLSPWLVFNLTRFDRPVLLTTNDGGTLVGANCSETYGGPGLGGWSFFCMLDTPGPAGADDSVRSAEQRRVALAYVRDHVTRVPVVVAARVGRTLDLYGISNLVHMDVGEERDRWASWSGIVTWWVLAPIGAVGLARCRRRDAWVLAMPVVTVLVTSVLFYGAHRIRSPLEPVLVVCAAVVIAGWVPARALSVDEPERAEVAG